MDKVRCGEDSKNISDCSFISMPVPYNCEQDIWLQCKGNKIVVIRGGSWNRVARAGVVGDGRLDGLGGLGAGPPTAGGLSPKAKPDNFGL